MADPVPKSRPDQSESDVLSALQSVEFEPLGPDALVEQIKHVADKLVTDHTTQGDLKIILRALKELRYAFKVFKPYRLRRKVTMFGSARTPPETRIYQMAVEFGRRIAEEGWMVVTGGGPGIMEAGHLGAGREMSFGLNIVLPFEQEANPIIAADEKLINFKYFFTRKLLFVKEVHAIVLFPGGFGTQDEGFETLTLVQTGKRDLMPIICVDEPGGAYWSGWREYLSHEMLRNRLISPADMSLFTIVDSVEAAVRELLKFYSVYHSMRYVRRKLVIRLNHELGDDMIARLNDEFRDIMTKPIVRSSALPQESDDPHLQDLPRLVFQFNRKDMGRLRQMVDVINSASAPPAADAVPRTLPVQPG
ncbi:MAG: TIGR00730 family Rossman fold protein [Planctomycetia bacterium]|nr:TIGR00730 family Rossman fold protein [Planctomycetia bacterium]